MSRLDVRLTLVRTVVVGVLLCLPGLAPSVASAAPTAIGGGCDVRDGGRITCAPGFPDGARGTGIPDAALTESDRSGRLFVRGLTHATAVAGDGRARCALRTGGRVSCWGNAPSSAPSGALAYAGPGELVEPVEVPGVDGATALAVDDHACVVVAGGAVRCWGNDDVGEASGQVPTNAGLDLPRRIVQQPVAVPGIPPATDVTATLDLTCIAATDGTVWCWGANRLSGRLGRGTALGSDDRGGPAAVPGLSGVAEIAASGDKVCARRTDGEVWCWGRFSWREPELTFQEMTARPFATPTKVAGVQGAVELAVGASSACARTAGGAVRCWGDNSLGQLGALARRSAAGLLVRELPDAVALDFAGHERPCALRATGTLSCWGGHVGQTAEDPADRASSTAVAVPARGISGATELAVSRNHWCALLAGGAARCTGLDLTGPREEAIGTDGPGAAPAPVFGLGPVTRMVSGAGHTCFLDSGEVRCIGLVEDWTIAVQTYNTGGAGALTGVTDLTSGLDHACALTTQSRVWCWGSLEHGQTGVALPTSGMQRTAAQRAVTQVAQVVASGNRTCVRRTSGEVLCWGAASGPDGQDWPAETPVALPGPATGLLVQGGRTCASFASASSVCFGPVAPTFTSLATCSLDAGQVRCTGDGSTGMLGTGSERFTVLRSVPVVQRLAAATITVPDPVQPPAGQGDGVQSAAPGPAQRPAPSITPTPAPGPRVARRAMVVRTANVARKGSLITFKLVVDRGDAACSGAVRATLKVGRRSVRARADLTETRGACGAVLRLRVPARAKGKAKLVWSVGTLRATVRVKR